MDNEMNLNEESQQQRMYRLSENLRKSEKGRAILENPVYQEAWMLLSEAIFDAFTLVPIQDKNQLQAVRIQYSLLMQLKQHFETVVRDGEFSAQELDYLHEQNSQLN